MLGSPKVHALLGKRSKQANGKRFGVYAETRNEVQFATWLRMTEPSGNKKEKIKFVDDFIYLIFNQILFN